MKAEQSQRPRACLGGSHRPYAMVIKPGIQPRSGNSSVPVATATGSGQFGDSAPAARQRTVASPRLGRSLYTGPVARATGTGLPLLRSWMRQQRKHPAGGAAGQQ